MAATKLTRAWLTRFVIAIALAFALLLAAMPAQSGLAARTSATTKTPPLDYWALCAETTALYMDSLLNGYAWEWDAREAAMNLMCERATTPPSAQL